ncbi:transglycosylase domain-containing protein [Methylovirgula sp. HY1]|uniref:transglycosylase domain-containing protein n=1 Tax=Methylovirgula sp. HY1 TaxID=2822761 RepID=UPI001C5B96E8|nr:PBP1A family penicillin-binding protein [Methylovirgula sp. HY1]QXX73503.1 Penicillin-binding protein 1F [Methylovirgula sp. HY1]
MDLFEELKSSRLYAQALHLYRKLARALLALDAFIDSSLYDSGERTRAFYATLAAWMDRLHVTGWRRLGVELFCEGSNLAVAGGILALFMAIPAFHDTLNDNWLKKEDLAVTFLDRYGQVVGRRGIKHDDSVPLEQMPRYLIQAVISTEDRRFFQHFGIDFFGTLRALTVNARADSVVQGGSSITQQLAKNLFLSNERTLSRKIKEAYLAFWLEGHLTKRQILQLYLDRMYMGGGTFGVQAAAQYYFGKSIRDVSLAEAAMLAGLFKAPSKYAPNVNLPAARARAADILQNIVDAGYLTEGQIYGALHNPATPIARSRDAAPDWYLDWAYDEVRKLADAHKLGADRVLTVRTALDPNLQKFADTTIEDQLRQYGHSYHVDQSAMVILDPSNGAVRTIVGGRDYGASQFNRAVDALRQPGSSFKPFVYLTALLTGKFKPSTIVVDGPVCLGNWCPHNYGGKYHGRVPLVFALAHSLNSVAVKLSIDIGEAYPVKGHNNVFEAAKRGRTRIIANARRLGITTPLPDTVSLPIGADGVNVMEMANAYATFANGGKKVAPFAATEITNSHGKVIYRHDRDTPPPKRIFDENVITELVSMMKQVVLAGTGRRAALDNIDVAGKTGTTNGYKDAWFMGYTGNYVGAIWFGNDDDTPTNRMTGGSLPAMTWHEIMAYAHQGIELKPLPGDPPPIAKTAPPTPAKTVAELGAPQRPTSLSAASIDVLGTIADWAKAAEKRQAETHGGGGYKALP